MKLMDRIKSGLLWGTGFGAVVFVIVSLVGNWTQIQQAYAQASLSLLGVAIMLVIGNYAVRFIRWDLYLRKLDIRIPTIDSASIFISGLVMSATPGKLGEVLKSYLLKIRSGVRVSSSVPVVIAERVTDVTALIVLSAAGAITFGLGGKALLIAAGLTFALPLFISWETGVMTLLRWAERFNPLEPHVEKLTAAYDSTRVLLQPSSVIAGTLLGIVGWGLECVALIVVCVAFEASIGLFAGAFAYSFSTLIGAASLLPGGVGPTEASLVALLWKFGLTKSVAAAVTITVRLLTLWFAVLLGGLTLLRYKQYLDEALDLDVVLAQDEKQKAEMSPTEQSIPATPSSR